MLTIKNFEKLKGNRIISPKIVLPVAWAYTIIEAKPYISPVMNDWMYIVKLKSQSNKEISFSLYRVVNKKDDGYQLYNTITGDYSIIKLESFRDMRTFAGILQKELIWINQKI